MGTWLFVAFHIISVGFCLFATRSALYCLSKYQVTPKLRYTLFGLIEARYVGILYVIIIFLLAVYSIVMAFFFL